MDARAAIYHLRNKTLSGSIRVGFHGLSLIYTTCLSLLRSLFALIKDNPKVDGLVLFTWRAFTDAELLAIIEGLTLLSPQLLTFELIGGDFKDKQDIATALFALPIPNLTLSLRGLDNGNFVIGEMVRALRLPGSLICNKHIMEQLVKSNLRELHFDAMEDAANVDLKSFMQNQLSNARLHSLSLGGLAVGDDLALVLFNTLRTLPLRNLNLDHGLVHFTEQSLLQFAAYLKTSELRVLSLQFNRLTDARVAPILPVLEDTQLESLDLGFNELTPAFLLQLVTILPQTKIRALKNIFSYMISPDDYVEVIKKLAETTKDDDTFVASACIVANRCHRFVQTVVTHYSHLVRLDLERYKLDTVCCTFLLELLNTAQLQALSLTEAHITDEGCEILAGLIKRSEGLKTLNLQKNDFQSKGTEFLLHALSGSIIEEINFNRNPIIDDRTVEIVMQFLPKLARLRKLFLSDSWGRNSKTTTFASVEFLVNGLRDNTSLEEIRLWSQQRVRDVLRLFGCKGHIIVFSADEMDLLAPYENKIQVLMAFSGACSTTGRKHLQSVFRLVPIEIVRLLAVMVWES